jgi:hypothetical protein
MRGEAEGASGAPLAIEAVADGDADGLALRNQSQLSAGAGGGSLGHLTKGLSV